MTPIDYRVAHRQNSRISILHNPTTGTNFAAPFCRDNICEVEAHKGVRGSEVLRVIRCSGVTLAILVLPGPRPKPILSLLLHVVV